MARIIKTCTIVSKYGTRKLNMGHIGTIIKQLIMNFLKVNTFRRLNQKNNQDTMSRLLTWVYCQEFCPRFNNMGISCPRFLRS